MESGEPKGLFRLLDHTADLCLEISGSDLPELFANAILAVYRLLGLPPDATLHAGDHDHEDASFVVAGVDQEDLLVRLLGELLFRAEADGIRFVPSRVSLCGEPGRVELRLNGRWEGFPLSSRYGGREIKAVTYHGAEIRQVQAGFLAHVVLDV